MIRIVIAALLIVLLGFYGIIFFFADLGPGESWFTRLAVALTFYTIVSAIMLSDGGYSQLENVLNEGTEAKLNELMLIVVPLAGILLGISATRILKSRSAG